MKKLEYDLVVIGGGPAGLAAALEARKNGVKKILICERAPYLGGILQQCIHNGFGLQYFKEELTGPEYASRFIDAVEQSDIDVKLGTMVMEILEDKKIIAVNREDGMFEIGTKALILAMGCRERTRGAITIPGSRPAGIMTAGTAQSYVNLEGFIPGKEVVILGSGDIGLIMARRLTLEGVNVKGVIELMPYSTGLIRNKVQCLDDFNIPLLLSHSIVEVHGKDRLEGVTIARVDQRLKPIQGTEQYVSCDTLLLSVGLIPENELSSKLGCEIDTVTRGPVVNEKRITNIPWVFACGNVLHVHDLVDNVTQEAEIAGRAAADLINQAAAEVEKDVVIRHDQNIGYVVPQHIDALNNKEKTVKFFLRVKNPDEHVRLVVKDNFDQVLLNLKKTIVEPGTMVTFNLPRELVTKDTSSISISIAREQAE
ncbi:NAD(P)/FAD-dependent oxidoreductase [Acetobacterium wieringae]|uniref:NAD(P)/FAD-dependent oxidoreductase n=1 Tax=Acetobacterium wieringae TaxID=52694 RepID=A0ABY6HBP9_9FIRM|nr:FAD/NAD(P)-binding oxidoreductase [Acetobacterium wieringae]UYO61934.1 NAD(P)/FAD-dependent oxidoreductase [Acetobacterium wieringae]VUZ28012.1 Ferredoxin--NADP reductase [Acetobacterium wieringae]